MQSFKLFYTEKEWTTTKFNDNNKINLFVVVSVFVVE